MARILLISTVKTETFIGDMAEKLSKDNEVWRYSILESKLTNYTSGEVVLFSTKNSKISIVLSAFKLNSYLKEIDFIHYHFINVYSVLIHLLVFNFSKCIKYATFWGSDFSLAKKKGRLSYLFFKRMDKILFSNVTSLNDFSTLYPILKVKLEIIKWPLSILELQKNIISTDKGVFDFNIPPGKQIVCVGTNGGKNQNHLKIIDELNKLDIKISDEFFFLFPAGYPKNNDVYINEIERKLNESNLSFYHIDTSFHTEIDLAHYRNMTDILIQVQNNDMFSGAMQEAIFAGAKIITGSWLPYEILDVNNVQLFKIDNFSELSSKLIEAKHCEFSPEMKKHNAEVIYSLSGWEIIKKQWFGLYKPN